MPFCLQSMHCFMGIISRLWKDKSISPSGLMRRTAVCWRWMSLLFLGFLLMESPVFSVSVKGVLPAGEHHCKGQMNIIRVATPRKASMNSCHFDLRRITQASQINAKLSINVNSRHDRSGFDSIAVAPAINVSIGVIYQPTAKIKSIGIWSYGTSIAPHVAFG